MKRYQKRQSKVLLEEDIHPQKGAFTTWQSKMPPPLPHNFISVIHIKNLLPLLQFINP